MLAWGHENEHFAHWMHTAGSQIGISRAMLRFSHWAVPVGQVPSTGKALTGRSSPRPAIMAAVTSWTKAGAADATAAGRTRVAVTSVGTSIWWRRDSVPSTASKLRRTMSQHHL